MTKNTVKKNDIISNETENKIIIDNKKSIRIFFNNEEEVILKIDLDNKKVLIDEINSWIRSRFGLDSKTRLVYLDKDNEGNKSFIFLLLILYSFLLFESLLYLFSFSIKI